MADSKTQGSRDDCIGRCEVVEYRLHHSLVPHRIQQNKVIAEYYRIEIEACLSLLFSRLNTANSRCNKTTFRPIGSTV